MLEFKSARIARSRSAGVPACEFRHRPGARKTPYDCAAPVRSLPAPVSGDGTTRSGTLLEPAAGDVRAT
jgi:hypothetical protein